MHTYTPANREIDHVVDVAASLAPSLWSRLVYAGCILRRGRPRMGRRRLDMPLRRGSGRRL